MIIHQDTDFIKKFFEAHVGKIKLNVSPEPDISVLDAVVNQPSLEYDKIKLLIEHGAKANTTQKALYKLFLSQGERDWLVEHTDIKVDLDLEWCDFVEKSMINKDIALFNLITLREKIPEVKDRVTLFQQIDPNLFHEQFESFSDELSPD